jgi:IS5 family transposase
MLRDRYDPLNLFEHIPTLGMQMDPLLTQMDTLLADDAIFQMVKTDLLRRFPPSADDGRPSTPVEGILRLLVVKHRYGWSFPATTPFVADSLVLRQFCRLYCEPVPDQRPLNRWAQRIRPATLHRLLDHITQVACHLQVTQGRTLRLDGTVVATNIHPPTDRTLLYDGVRGLSRALGKATTLLQEMSPVAQETSTDYAPQARAKRKRLMEVARQRGEAAAARRKTTYRDRIDLSTTVVARATHVQQRLTPQATAATQRVVKTLAQSIPLVEQVITQTTRRVLRGEEAWLQQAASSSLVSFQRLAKSFQRDNAAVKAGVTLPWSNWSCQRPCQPLKDAQAANVRPCED